MFKKGKPVTSTVKSGTTKSRTTRTSDNDADDKRGLKNRAKFFDNDPDDMSRILKGGNKNSGKKK
jgi:hypothetical protein